MQITKAVEDFVAICKQYMSKKDAVALVAKANFSVLEWLRVQKECGRNGFRTMQVFAMKKATEKASTLTDWVAIADQASATGLLRKRAYEEILRFEPSDDDIQLLKTCGSKHLRSVGWYLAGRQRIVNK